MRLLVVEDEAKTAEFLAKGLKESGFVVDVALNGLDGRYLIEQQEYDLIILDVMLPGLNGWQLLQLIRQRGATPVLLVCEGVLMYLPPAQVHAVLAEFAQHAPPGSRMVLDVMTRRAVGCAARHASVRSTGAEFRWGVGRMAELEAVHPRLQLLREQSVAEGYGWPGIAMDLLWRPWLGAPLYGLATLGIRE